MRPADLLHEALPPVVRGARRESARLLAESPDHLGLIMEEEDEVVAGPAPLLAARVALQDGPEQCFGLGDLAIDERPPGEPADHLAPDLVIEEEGHRPTGLVGREPPRPDRDLDQGLGRPRRLGSLPDPCQEMVGPRSDGVPVTTFGLVLDPGDGPGGRPVLLRGLGFLQRLEVDAPVSFHLLGERPGLGREVGPRAVRERDRIRREPGDQDRKRDEEGRIHRKDSRGFSDKCSRSAA